MKIQNINPANLEVFAQVESSSVDEVVNAVSSAKNAAVSWKELGLERRLEILKKLYSILESEKTSLCKLSTESIGMPVSMVDILDVGSGLHYFKGYLDSVRDYLKPYISYEDNVIVNTVYFEPIGVSAVIVPWNFPFCNFVWGVIPNLLVGNTVVFKHSEECAYFGQKLDELVSKAGLPPGVFTQVFGDGEVGDTLVHQDIDLIHFTGSTAVGRHLYQIASEKFIKIVLELGGSAPGIVFPDSDMAKLSEAVFFNRFSNSGQACDGLKRLIVHKDVLEKVLIALSNMLHSKKVGDPQDPASVIGPLVSKQQVNILQSQVDDAIAKGAVLQTKTDVPQVGFYFNPMILTNISTDMRVWTEETFGPVLPIMTFETEKEALALANDTIYGLGGYVFTENSELALRIASQINTGMVSINGSLYLQPQSPFGGTKLSGIGREHGIHGFQELCQIKVVATEK